MIGENKKTWRINVCLNSSKQSSARQITFESTVSVLLSVKLVDVKSENKDTAIVAGMSKDNEYMD